MSTNEGSVEQTDRAAVVDAAGVEVEKVILDDDGSVETLRYEIRSSRDEPVVVRLLDTVPPELPRGAVGFHPEYYGASWDASGNRVEFQHQLEANETISTVLGVQLPEGLTPTELNGSPTLRVGTKPSEFGDTLSEASSADRDSPSVDSPRKASTDPDLTLDLDEDRLDESAEGSQNTAEAPVASETSGSTQESGLFEFDNTGSEDSESDTEATAAANDSGPKTDDPTTGPRSSGSESVAAALAAELRSGGLSEQDRETLELELGVGASSSTEALLDHVQSRIGTKREQLQAEIDSLESSVEQLYGVKADAEEFEGLRSAVHRLDSAKADADRLDSVAEQVSELSSSKAGVSRVKRLANGLDELQSAAATTAELRQLRDQLDALREETAAETDLQALDDRVEQLVADRIDPLEDRADESERRLDDLEAQTASLDDQLDTKASTDRVETVETELTTVREEAATVEDRDELAEELSELADRTVTQDRFTDTIEELRANAATTDDAEALRGRIDDVESVKADTTRLDELESTIEDEYVAVETIDGTIDHRVRRGLGTVLTLGLAFGALLLSFVLAATQGAVPAGIAFTAGAIVIGGWWLVIS